jgi:hypothetical protein
MSCDTGWSAGNASDAVASRANEFIHQEVPHGHRKKKPDAQKRSVRLNHSNNIHHAN